MSALAQLETSIDQAAQELADNHAISYDDAAYTIVQTMVDKAKEKAKESDLFEFFLTKYEE